MEAERANSSLRRGGSLNRLGSSGRLGSSSFVSRQRQLLEGHIIEGGEVKKTKFVAEKEHASFRKTKKHTSCKKLDRKVTDEQQKVVSFADTLDFEDSAKSDIENCGELSKENLNEDSNVVCDSEQKLAGNKRGVLVRSQRSKCSMLDGKRISGRQHSIDRLITKSHSPRTLQAGSSRNSRQASRSPAIRPASAQTLGTKPLGQTTGRKDSIEDTSLSLKLPLKGLTGSDDSDDSDDIVDEQKDEIISPRNCGGSVSPRKSVLPTSKSVEAKSSLIRRRDSDTSLIKPRAYNRTASSERSVPQNLSLNITCNDHLVDEKPVLLKRTSSGRKLPVPIEKPVKSVGLKKSESDSSFLSISKDGNTEYVSLDFTSTFPDKDITSGLKLSLGDSTSSICSADMNTENRMKQRSESKMLSKAGVPGSENGVKSPPVSDNSTKPPLEKKPSKSSVSGTMTSPRKIIAASPRSTAAKVGSSPRVAARVPSPRNSQTSLSRASQRERTTTPRATTPRATTPRAERAATPRAERATTPRAERATTPRSMEKRASRENLKSIDTVDSGRKPTRKVSSDGSLTMQNGSVTEASTLKRRNSSGNSVVSPRPGSPVKAKHLLHDTTLQTSRIEEEPVRPRFPMPDSCQQMDLQQLITMFQVHMDDNEQKVTMW